MIAKAPAFATQVLAWYDLHGRKTLPWQNPATPYRVWVSEIMLQQTQVTTVIPYFERFLARFPTVMALADASIDEVLHHWAGLGYYARARNLHKAACRIRDHHQGEFPGDFEAVSALPGVGRSTAGAILALSHDLPYAILDGNVKRVLARHAALAGWPGEARTTARLWQIAKARTPVVRVGAYTQAMMDLGALVCTRRNPRCGACPVRKDCQAYITERQHELPSPRPKKALPMRETVMLVVLNGQGEVLLERRPPTGVWGGLWSLPEVNGLADRSSACEAWCVRTLGCLPQRITPLSVIEHGLTHFRLRITPCQIEMGPIPDGVMEDGRWLWYNRRSSRAGMPAPVKRLIDSFTGGLEELNMARTVHCVKLGKEAEGFDYLPYPGELGKRIYTNVSKEGWSQWMRHQTMLINEYRLTPADPKARKFLEEEMEKFLFGSGSKPPEGYVPPEEKG